MVDTPAYKYASNSRVGAIFAEHKRTQERLVVPVIVGEWGGNAEGTEWLPHVRFLLETFENYKWSYTYWHYFNGLLSAPLADVLVRPYPKAVTGSIIEWKYDDVNQTFTLVYNQTVGFDVPTIVYAHKQVKNITVNGEYIINKIAQGEGYDIHITTGVGQNKVEINF